MTYDSSLRRCLRAMALLMGLWLAAAHPDSASAEGDERPNILWITSEDNGPHLGCYGDDYADTPHLDGLADSGLIYLNCWSTAPVCAPARTTIISGIYPTTTGSQHMRSMTRLPDDFRMYPQYLREAGYYCTNNSKEDYNLEKPGAVWDESSRQAHWKNRADGQPFFAIFNLTVSHESQIRKRPHTAVHDPDEVRVRAYHPDTPEVRRDWAQYYDKLTEMDRQAGRRLKELEDAGLADDTIIFYYGDHGSGMPRNKRWPYNSGLNVPLIVHIPEKFRHLAPAEYEPGETTDRLVGFIDLAPTLLSICGIEPPEQFQGHAFLGEHEDQPCEYQFGFRDRMDERYDMVRTIRDKEYVYIVNYMPHKVYGQYIDYMFQTTTTRVWKQLYDEGKLEPPMTHFWERKPPEELYELATDPDEVNNLANSAAHQAILERFRSAHVNWVYDTRDLGFLPEQEIHTRSAARDITPYELAQDPNLYPLADIYSAAAVAQHADPQFRVDLVGFLTHADPAVRYWGAMGLLMLGADGAVQQDELIAALQDPSPSVQILVAQILAAHGSSEETVNVSLEILLRRSNLESNDVYVCMLALNSIDELDKVAIGLKSAIEALPTQHESVNGRMKSYVGNLIKKILLDLE